MKTYLEDFQNYILGDGTANLVMNGTSSDDGTILQDKSYKYGDNEGALADTYRKTYMINSKNEKCFNVDWATRKISGGETFNGLLGIVGDKNAEIVYFRMPRYFDDMDLLHKTAVIQYINADGTSGYYATTAKYVDAEEDSDGEYETNQYIYVGWIIDDKVTAAAGTVQFSLKLFEREFITKKTENTNESSEETEEDWTKATIEVVNTYKNVSGNTYRFRYVLNTQISTGTIANGLNTYNEETITTDESIISSSVLDELDTLIDDIDGGNTTTGS